MLKLQLLTAFIINLDLVAVEQIDSWVESPQIIPSGRCLTADGVILFRHEYDAVISIERYPHSRHPAELLFAHICAWLLDHDSDRDQIATPRTDVDILDDDTADIEITISFEEDVQGVSDPAGPIKLNGQRYRLDTALSDYAGSGVIAP
jgi:hypothetical protein